MKKRIGRVRRSLVFFGATIISDKKTLCQALFQQFLEIKYSKMPPISGGSEGRSAFRNHAGVDEPTRKIVSVGSVNLSPRKLPIVNTADSTVNKEYAMRRKQLCCQGCYSLIQCGTSS